MDNNQNNMYQNPYQEPYQAPQKKTNVLAIVGMILGIISIPADCFAYIGCIFGIAGLICSIVSLKNGKNGMGIAGIICSTIGIIGGIIMTIIALAIIESGYYYYY